MRFVSFFGDWTPVISILFPRMMEQNITSQSLSVVEVSFQDIAVVRWHLSKSFVS